MIKIKMMPPANCAVGSHKFVQANIRYCAMNGFAVGQLVQRNRSIRKIETIYSEIWGGVRLNEPVEDFVSWNIDELEYVA